MRAFLAGDPPRKIVTRAVWNVARARKMKYLALYDMNNVTPPQLEAFLARVGDAMERF
jgi:NAD(P)H dehydrogenase (quinone)